jgi:drug/metabolite transporter (DMT)-like permease
LPGKPPIVKHTFSDLAIRAAPLTFVFFWSTGFIAAKYGLPYAEPFTFLTARMALVVVILAGIVLIWRPPLPSRREALHSLVTGFFVHTLYLGGVFVSLSQGVPAGISALIPGLQPVLMSTIASRWLGERVAPLQWAGLALGVVGVLLVLNDRNIRIEGTVIGWIATFVSLVGITLGTMYQKRHGGGIDWRPGNLVQYAGATCVFAIAASLFETRVIDWTGAFIFALGWSVVVMSVLTVALMYWLIKRIPAAQVASLFYLVPATTAAIAWLAFDERLNALAILGMAICAFAVFLVNYRKS